MRVWVYSHIRLFGESLADCLVACEKIAEVRVCHRGENLPDDTLRFTPDVVLIDMTGEGATEKVRCVKEVCPELCMLGLAIPETTEHVIACADAGLDGYVPYQASLDELCVIVSHARKGEFACHPKIASSLFREVRRRRSRYGDTDAPLTHRESEVLGLVAKGLCNKEIARELVLSVATVKNHLHNTFTKLHVRGRTEALARLRIEPWLAGTAHTVPWQAEKCASH